MVWAGHTFMDAYRPLSWLALNALIAVFSSAVLLTVETDTAKRWPN